MPSFFCSCGFANEFIFNKPDFCGKCRSSLGGTISAKASKRRVIIEEDDEDEDEDIEPIPKKKSSRARIELEDEDDDEEIAEIDGINLNNIKFTAIANDNRDHYVLTEDFIKSNTNGYIPPPRQGVNENPLEKAKELATRRSF